MKKVSLLAASVAFALAGCGGSDGGSGDATPGGVIITGFDGYFNQAVAFQDTDNDGELDIDTLGQEGGDIVFGLTDENGQITVPSSIEGALALQTLTPGGTVQQALIAHNNDEFEVAGKYTIDMDHPAQAMAHELVFRAPASSKVISPITDLVSIEAEKNGGDLEAAETAVNAALGGTEDTPVALYDDFVEGDNADAELHKTAQILTESKAANPTTYEDKATEFAEEADRIVENDLSDDQVNNPDIKPVIIDDNGTLTPVSNSLLVVDSKIAQQVQVDINALDLEVNGNFGGTNIQLTDQDGNLLFQDSDLDGILVDISLVDNSNLKALQDAGLSVSYASSALELVSMPSGLTQAGSFVIELQAFDVDSEGAKSTNPTSTFFTIDIESANSLPELDTVLAADLQTQIDTDWSLKVGTPISNMVLDITGLFTDPDGDSIKFGTLPRLSSTYLEKGISAKYSSDYSQVILSGEPTAVASLGTISIDASDDFHGHGEWTTVTLDLPEIEVGTAPSKHALEDQFLHFVEIGNGDYNIPRAWCDTVYFDSETKTAYWNIRDLDNDTVCDTGSSKADLDNFEVGFAYTINDKSEIISEDETMSLRVVSQTDETEDPDLQRYLVSFGEKEQFRTNEELYSYYKDASTVEGMIAEPAGKSENNAPWVDRIAHIAMPPFEGSKDIEVTAFDVNGIVQQFNYGDSQYTSASLRGGDSKTCSLIKDIYLDYGSIRIYGDSDEANNFFNSNVAYRDDSEGGCYFDFSPIDSSLTLPKGLYTIEAKPERSDEGERIILSFRN